METSQKTSSEIANGCQSGDSQLIPSPPVATSPPEATPTTDLSPPSLPDSPTEVRSKPPTYPNTTNYPSSPAPNNISDDHTHLEDPSPMPLFDNDDEDDDDDEGLGPAVSIVLEDELHTQVPYNEVCKLWVWVWL